MKTEYNGYIYDSKFEASVASDLDMQLKEKSIVSWERQFLVEIMPYNKFGDVLPRLKVRHKIDFRVENPDGSFTLIEAKGFETTEWRRKRKWLEELWLPEHPDHEYLVVKQGKTWKRNTRQWQ